MFDQVRAGRSPDDLAREFEPTSHSIRAWIASADRNEGRREEAVPGLAAAERDELARLRREVRQLRLEELRTGDSRESPQRLRREIEREFLSRFARMRHFGQERHTPPDTSGPASLWLARLPSSPPPP